MFVFLTAFAGAAWAGSQNPVNFQNGVLDIGLQIFLASLMGAYFGFWYSICMAMIRGMINSTYSYVCPEKIETQEHFGKSLKNSLFAYVAPLTMSFECEVIGLQEGARIYKTTLQSKDKKAEPFYLALEGDIFRGAGSGEEYPVILAPSQFSTRSSSKSYTAYPVGWSWTTFLIGFLFWTALFCGSFFFLATYPMYWRHVK